MQDLPVVRDFMTRHVVVLKPEMGISDAIDIFTSKRFSGAPVMDASGELVGVLSEGDCVSWLTNMRYYEQAHGQVSDYMSREVCTIPEGEDVFSAAEMLQKHNYRRLPVVDEDGNLVGIVSRCDVIKAGQVYCQKKLTISPPDSGYINDELKARLGKDGVPNVHRHVQ